MKNESCARNMKMGKMKSIYSFLALLTCSVFVTGCGGLKTNPTEGYEDLRDAGKPQPIVASNQLLAESVFRRPTVANDTIPLNFQEGKSASYVFDAGCFYDGVSYTLVAKNLPAGATLVRSIDPAKPDQFILAWTPAKGTIGSTEHSHRSIAFEIMYEITGAPSREAALQIMPLNHKEYSYQINLFSNEQDPTITKLDVKMGGLKALNLGDKVALTIEALDPGAYEDHVPVLKVEDDVGGATDANTLKSASFVTVGDVKLVNGKFVFEAVFDSSKLVMPDGANEATARFNVFIKGVAGYQSAVLPVNITVYRKADSSTLGDQATALPKNGSTK